MTQIELPDEQAAALRAQAEAQGVTLEIWLKKLTEGSGPTTLGALDWSQCAAVESVPGKVSGAWVFRDTRLPVTAVFENLVDGVSMDELLDLYDGLTREHIQAVLYFAARSLATPSLAQ